MHNLWTVKTGLSKFIHFCGMTGNYSIQDRKISKFSFGYKRGEPPTQYYIQSRVKKEFYVV